MSSSDAQTGRVSCPNCGGIVSHVERWDSYGCFGNCGQWIEGPCDCGDDCPYKGRPLTTREAFL